MKLPARKNSNQRRRQPERGSVVLLLLVLLGIMAVYLACNNLALNNLRRELGVIEKKQLEKFSRPPAPLPPKP